MRLLPIAVFCAAAQLPWVPAAAQSRSVESVDQQEELAWLNSETVSPALSVVTGNHLVQMGDDGSEFISAIATSGLNFEIHFRGCEGEEVQRCKAMYMVAVWEAQDPSVEEQLRATIDQYLLQTPIVNAGILDGGSPYVARYVIADYGTRQGNVLSEFSNFIRSAEVFQQAIFE